MDSRPILGGDCYPNYVDGVGWLDNAARNAHYCPVCNPKNYDEWIERIRIQQEEKATLAVELQLQQEKAQQIADKDRQRAAKVFTSIGCRHLTSCIDGRRCNFHILKQ